MRFLLLLSALSVLPAAVCISLIGIPSQAEDSGQIAEPLVPESHGLAQMPDRIWVPLRQAISIDDLSQRLVLSVKDLSELNGISPKQKLRPGTWLVLPASSRLIASRELSLQLAHLRVTAPLIAPPPVIPSINAKADTPLANHNYSLSEMPSLHLNPRSQPLSLVIGSTPGISEAVPLLPIRADQGRGANRPSAPPPVDKAPSKSSVSFIWPAKGVFISGYGWRWGRMHKGIDIANSTGTPILASKDGIVSYASWSSGYGYLVELSHADGSSTRYAHNSQLLVRKGQIVPQGAKISLMGSTGRSTGPHLHFEIRRSGGAAVDPIQVLPPSRA